MRWVLAGWGGGLTAGTGVWAGGGGPAGTEEGLWGGAGEPLTVGVGRGGRALGSDCGGSGWRAAGRGLDVGGPRLLPTLWRPWVISPGCIRSPCASFAHTRRCWRLGDPCHCGLAARSPPALPVPSPHLAEGFTWPDPTWWPESVGRKAGLAQAWGVCLWGTGPGGRANPRAQTPSEGRRCLDDSSGPNAGCRGLGGCRALSTPLPRSGRPLDPDAPGRRRIAGSLGAPRGPLMSGCGASTCLHATRLCLAQHGWKPATAAGKCLPSNVVHRIVTAK